MLSKHDQSRADKARDLASRDYKSLKEEKEGLADAIRALQSTDDPSLAEEHDRLQERYQKVEALLRKEAK